MAGTSLALTRRDIRAIPIPPERGIALEGPDMGTMTAAYWQNEKGTHVNDAGLKAYGLLWAQRVEVYLDALLY
jgi:hypothetical protein